jgi:23S rRNA pseudouridine1911/1915/1917 synthase
MNLHLLYEDRSILVLNKPAGLVVHPGAGHSNGTLVDLLKEYAPLAPGSSPERPGLVHRLDKDTEGIMVVAKTDEAYHDLVTQFKERRVQKYYYAMVRGDMVNPERVLDFSIGRSKKNPLKQQIYPNSSGIGKPSQTHIWVLDRFRTKTLIQAKPISGRMHQVRVHLAHIGHPVMGDPVYGPLTRSATGQLLQAYSLTFSHPQSGKRLGFQVPLSKRLKG